MPKRTGTAFRCVRARNEPWMMDPPQCQMRFVCFDSDIARASQTLLFGVSNAYPWTFSCRRARPCKAATVNPNALLLQRMRRASMTVWVQASYSLTSVVADDTKFKKLPKLPKLNFNPVGSTRGSKFKLRKEMCRYDIRKYSFCYRVVNVWNSLPDYVVEADSVDSFKSRLDKYWVKQQFAFNNQLYSSKKIR